MRLRSRIPASAPTRAAVQRSSAASPGGINHYPDETVREEDAHAARASFLQQWNAA
jgi:hypothetical protein